MKNWKVLWGIIGMLTIVVVLLLTFLFRTKELVVIDSFESCAAAGNPILEIYPEQCMTNDGRVFIKDVALPPEDEGVACTMEALICPDGTYVGRVGPDCEFEACPGEK